MLAAGADLAYVAAQLGHANPATTLRIYAHWVPGTRRVTTAVLDTAAANVRQTLTEKDGEKEEPETASR
jgi:integrase